MSEKLYPASTWTLTDAVGAVNVPASKITSTSCMGVSAARYAAIDALEAAVRHLAAEHAPA